MRKADDKGLTALRFALITVWLITMVMVMIVTVVADIEMIVGKGVVVIHMKMKMIEAGERDISGYQHKHSNHHG